MNATAPTGRTQPRSAFLASVWFGPAFGACRPLSESLFYRPMSKPPLLSLITVTWNHRAELDEYLAAIESCRERWGDRLELVLVDNASADDTAAFVKDRAPWANVIRNDANLGFAEGCNVGLRVARGRYLMLLNPDAYVNHEALAGMLAYLRGHRRAGAVGCRLLHGDGMPQISANHRTTAWGYFCSHSIAYPLLEKLGKLWWKAGQTATEPFVTGWLMGSCIMIPRAVFDKVGGLEASYFMYAEDADWCERIRRAGWDVVHHPGFSMFHRQKGSARRAPEFTFRRVYRSLLHYANRNLTGFEYWAMILMMMADMVVRLPVYAVYSIVRPARLERLRSVWRLLVMLAARNPDLYPDPVPGSGTRGGKGKR